MDPGLSKAVYSVFDVLLESLTFVYKDAERASGLLLHPGPSRLRNTAAQPGFSEYIERVTVGVSCL